MRHRKAARSLFACSRTAVESLECRRLLSTVSPPFTPAEIRGAYAVNGISFTDNGVTTTGTGAGETIAIYSGGGDGTELVSDANTFSSTYGLEQFNGTGEPTLSVVDGSGSFTDHAEECLDVEWAHAIAPMANIVVLEDSGDVGFSAAAAKAAALPGVSVVSISYSSSDSSSDSSYDADYVTPSGHQGVTFLAATGDVASQLAYPALSGNVIGVGGTNVIINSGNTWNSENAWPDGGGGVSTHEAQPYYQFGKVNGASTTNKSDPDVSADADSAVTVYCAEAGGWFGASGTSLATPLWAGLIAITNQGRALRGAPTLAGSTQTLDFLYSLPQSDFHDIISGGNGHPTSTGYDLATGRGSPIANLLVPDLANMDETSLPSPWASADIGSPTIAGWAHGSGSSYTIGGSGADIGGTSDQFQYMYEPFTGNGTITAEVDTQDQTNVSAKSGVMFRNTLDANSAQAMTVVTPGQGTAFMYRTTAGGSSADVQSTGPVAPFWVRMVRNGNLFTSYSSPDGITWTEIGSETIAMNQTIYVGLAGTSHNNSQNAITTFSNVSVVAPVASIVVTPAQAAVARGGTQTYTALAYDASGDVLAVQPSFTFSVNGGGTVNASTGVYTAPSTGTLATVTATAPTLPGGSTTVSGTALAGVLNSPWLTSDVGTVGVTGFAYDLNGTTTVEGAGHDVYGTADAFRYDYQTLTGNGEITAQVTSESGINKAGVMIRNSLASNDQQAFLWTSSSSNILQDRAASGGSTVTSGSGAGTWLRLVRVGSMVTAFGSSDGITWTQEAVITIAFTNATIYFGLADDSGNTTSQGTAVFANVSVSTAVAQPSVATAAAASPSPVTTGTTTALSVLGGDPSGESNLTYAWSATTIPAGATAPAFSINGTNASKNTVATFSMAGLYTFTVTITDASSGLTTTSTVSVGVNATFANIVISPAAPSAFDGQTVQLSAKAVDQFGNALASQPSFTWSVASGSAGGVSSTGLYTAPAAGPAADTIKASSAAVTGSTMVTTILSVINGTAGDDTIQLIRSGANLAVYLNNPTTPLYTVPFAPLVGLTVNTLGGNDAVNIDFSGGASPVPSAGLTVNGSTGDDSLTVTGTSGNDTAAINASTITFNASPITYNAIESIIINGNGGADTLTQTAQPGNSATLAFNASATGRPSSFDTLNIDAGNFTFTAPAAGSGIAPLSLAALSISSGASVAVSTAAAHADRWSLTLGALSLNGSAQLDLGGNDMLVHNGDLSAITSEIAAGSASGAWTGSGITSSAAAGDPTHLASLGVISSNDGSANPIYSTFDNQTVVITDVLVKFTYIGDANIDGQVDGSDYTRIDNGFNNHLTGWINGDFNYDGVVDGSDYTLIDNAFNTQAAPQAQIADNAAAAANAIVQQSPVFSSTWIDWKKKHR
jgi:hypothetical protein